MTDYVPCNSAAAAGHKKFPQRFLGSSKEKENAFGGALLRQLVRELTEVPRIWPKPIGSGAPKHSAFTGDRRGWEPFFSVYQMQSCAKLLESLCAPRLFLPALDPQAQRVLQRSQVFSFIKIGARGFHIRRPQWVGEGSPPKADKRNDVA